MERFCENCHSLVNGEVKFCPMCGSPMKSAVDLDKRDDPIQPDFGSNEIRASGYAAPQYGEGHSPYGQYNVPPQMLTTEQWLGTIILCSCLGIISVILNVIWGYCSDVPEPKRSFSRAMLIVNIISTVLGIVLAFVLAGMRNSPFLL